MTSQSPSVWIVSFWDGEYAANRSVWTTKDAAEAEKQRLGDAYIAEYHPTYAGHPCAVVEEFVLDFAADPAEVVDGA